MVEIMNKECYYKYHQKEAVTFMSGKEHSDKGIGLFHLCTNIKKHNTERILIFRNETYKI